MILPLLLSLLHVQAEPPAPTITITAPTTLDNASVLRAARALKAGEYYWAPQTAPEGPMLMVVSLQTQRAIVYRNGVPIGITTVSSGKDGHETPVGIFTVLQKKKEHYSNLYNNAPMPFMQRLTWDGIALHAGKLPGHAASHGCIRLPDKFATLLYDQTKLGMTVVVTKRSSLPSIAAAADLIGTQKAGAPAAVTTGVFWDPDRSPTGSVSLVVSTADRSMTAIRGGRIIGRVPVAVARRISHPYLYSFKVGFTGATAGTVVDAAGSGAGTGAAAEIGTGGQWTRVALPGQSLGDELQAGDVTVADKYRAGIAGIIAPGTTVVLTPDTLSTTASDLQDFLTSN